MPVYTKIAKPNLYKIDPDKDGLPGLSPKRTWAEQRIKQLAKEITHLSLGSPEWYDVLYLLILEYGNNIKYLNPVFAKLGGLGVIINSILVYGIKLIAKRSMVKQIDLKNPENL